MGFGGDDLLTGGVGDDYLDGGAGTDTAMIAGAYGDYAIEWGGETIVVTDVNGTDGSDTLGGIS